MKSVIIELENTLAEWINKFKSGFFAKLIQQINACSNSEKKEGEQIQKLRKKGERDIEEITSIPNKLPCFSSIQMN